MRAHRCCRSRVGTQLWFVIPQRTAATQKTAQSCLTGILDTIGRRLEEESQSALAALSRNASNAEATSDAHAAARAAVDKLRMAVTNEDGDAASERAREAAAAALRAAGLGDEMRRRLRRSRPGKFALVHQVLEYLYVGGWAALNDDCRVLREQKISRVCSVVTADTPRTLPAFVTHHLHVVCRDDENAPLGSAFMQISAFLDEARRAREIAYVHCGAGVSRACASVAAYLIWSGSLSAGEALRIVQNRRPQCRPNAGFKRQLGAWAERCRGAVCCAARCSPPTPAAASAGPRTRRRRWT